MTAAATHVVACNYSKQCDKWEFVEHMYFLTSVTTRYYVSNKISHIILRLVGELLGNLLASLRISERKLEPILTALSFIPDISGLFAVARKLDFSCQMF